MKYIGGFAFLLFLLIAEGLRAQPFKAVIPGYTGYLQPAEENEEAMFSEKDGLHNWTDAQQQLSYHFYLRHAGTLTLSLLAKNETGSSRLQVSMAGKKWMVTVPQSKTFGNIKIGSIDLKDSGFYAVTIQAIKYGKVIADIQSLQLQGAPVKDIHFNSKTRRNAASVHLVYPLPDTAKIVSFYNEVTVPKDADILHTYFMACGFARGYFGMQVNSATERRVIFSVWDAGKEAVDRNKVTDDNKVQLIAKGEDVFAGGFGNEGTGGHSHWIYNWKAGETYKFLVTAVPDSASQTTIYTGYFYSPDLDGWKLIASFRAPKDGNNLSHLYSFVEDFDGRNGQLYRGANFGNQWVMDEENEWKEVTQCSFSCDATGKAGDRIDFGGGVKDGQFYLWNGGFKPSDASYKEVFNRPANNVKPIINLYHQVDSVVQSDKDAQEIFEAVKSKKIDTTGSVNGVYYQLLKEGSGNKVMLSDTVSVYYKGSLLKDGLVFDETKNEPARFPLNRLIKGWQLGLPLCKVGGKIRLVIPSALGYSIRSRSKDIPPNSVLVFDVEVVDAVKASNAVQ